MTEIQKLKQQLKYLLKEETKLRCHAKKLAKPYEQAAHRVHKEWVKTYNRLRILNKPKTLDDAWGESSTLHGCNPCH